MSFKGLLSNLNPILAAEAIEAKVLESLAAKAKLATAAALTEVPMLDDLLDGKPVNLSVGPITIPAFEVPIQLKATDRLPPQRPDWSGSR